MYVGIPGQAKGSAGEVQDVELGEDEKKRRLVLHFGFPRTVCTWDRANNRSTEAELNRVLCEMGWGTLDLDTGAWIMVSEEPCVESPDSSLISYWEYLNTLFPTGPAVDVTTRHENLQQLSERSSRFTSTNEPGQKFRPMYEQMVRCLTLPKTVMKGLHITKVTLNEASIPEDPSVDDAANAVRFGRYQFLPSFFNMLLVLQKEKRAFSLVLHAFDQEELESVRKEMGMFCEGKHPCYNGQFKTRKVVMLGAEQGSRDLRLKSEYMGVMDRASDTLSFQERNCSPPAPPPAEKTEEEAEQSEEPAEPAEPPAPAFEPTAYVGHAQIYAGLQTEILEETSCVGILDDAEHWKTQNFSETAGKVVYVDSGETKVQHVFFDGNILGTSTNSVDIRDAVSREPVPFEEAKEVYFHRVNPVQAIVDPEYYIKALQNCEAKHLEAIVAQKKASSAKKVDPRGKLSREELLKLPHKEYLYHTVMSSLLPALELAQRDRPADPINFIAFYMLRHPRSYQKNLVDEPAAKAL